MLYSYFIEKLIGLQGVLIKNVENNEKITTISLEMKRKTHKCPCCNEKTDSIHDYRLQKIKDIHAFGKLVYINLRKRRYVCKHCGKRFYENIDFLPRYHRMTNRLAAFVVDKLREEHSFSSVAREVKLSVSTVIRIFDHIGYASPNAMPNVLAIDEFKGNTGGEKYQCILTDPATGIVLDILPSRNSAYLIQYFKSYHIQNRNNVKCFISDMWQPYTDLASCFFKEATQIIDKYHFIRQCIWAFEAVRKREQKKYGKENRKCFKNSKRILTKRKIKLTPDQKERVESILYISPQLHTAYMLKESFYKVIDCTDRASARQMMSDWIYEAENSGLQEYIKCAKTMTNWQTGILNSFSSPYTNGFTEGCNNKIKVLKRNAYGYRNFKRFRNRILHMFYYKHEKNEKENAAA